MIKRKRNIKVLCCVLRPVSFWDNTLIVRYNLVFVILCWPPPTAHHLLVLFIWCYGGGGGGWEREKEEGKDNDGSIRVEIMARLTSFCV